ncbi:MAG: gamma-glutamyltransferase family protein [Synergistaceae bacterium]|nr:gamma-glutamyltransferase family protein [Synergistaceae bacterium]
MRYDPFLYRYPSGRNVVYASRGMAATSDPLAAGAGVDILKKGGNAVDAAIAAAAVLTVVEPMSNGLGSDALALVWHEGKLRGINACGPAPLSYGIDAFAKRGMGKIPTYGWGASTVPGAPGMWAELSSRMGRLSLADTLAPAIEYARGGFAVPVNISRLWKRTIKTFAGLGGETHAGWFETFCPGGRAPEPGEIFRLPAMSLTLEAIAETSARSFYTGETARKIVDFSRATGGFFSEDDFASFRPEWVEPISINYKGFDVWEIPPNSQGIVALMALGLMRDFDFSGHDDPAVIHKQIEAVKISFADAKRYVADPRFAKVPVDETLSGEYLARRRSEIGNDAALRNHGDPYSGGTVYLCTADGEGNMVSYIQSNFRGTGAGVVPPGTGVSLNNRALCFELDPGHPNALEGGKRPYNTIIPGFITKGGEPIGPFGVMGAYMQPQGHLQVVMNCVDFGMNPQEALDAPRWQWTGGMDVSFEPGFNGGVIQKLERMGHSVSIAADPYEFGRGEIIWKTGSGTFAGAAEPRADGCVSAW